LSGSPPPVHPCAMSATRIGRDLHCSSRTCSTGQPRSCSARARLRCPQLPSGEELVPAGSPAGAALVRDEHVHSSSLRPPVHGGSGGPPGMSQFGACSTQITGRGRRQRGQRSVGRDPSGGVRRRRRAYLGRSPACRGACENARRARLSGPQSRESRRGSHQRA
jgi:hypothetical protein